MTAAIAESISIDRQELEQMVTRLEGSGDYRILRRVTPRTRIHAPDGSPTRRGIFLDVETTGLDFATDEIIELAMVAFDYTDDGRTFAVHEPFQAMRDPGRPIPPGITGLTGITDAMVAGRSIELAEVVAFVSPASLLIAHNAAFDRPFCEKLCPAFAAMPWACSWREIPWADEGFDGARLSHLAAGHGLFFDGHRAVNDCRAGIEVLSRTLPRSGRTGFEVLLGSAQKLRWRVWATAAPYQKRAILKGRGYRWNDGCYGRPKSWHIDVDAEALDNEREFLRREIYREDMAIEAGPITAFDRYSTRC
jgi:DNA polymerase III subunit epsilon